MILCSYDRRIAMRTDNTYLVSMTNSFAEKGQEVEMAGGAIADSMCISGEARNVGGAPERT